MAKAKITDEERLAAEAQIVDQSKRIEFYLTEYSVELLTQKMSKEEFVIPKYQREFTWEDERRSRFIESVVMGLPIPFLFFWEMPDGRLEVVDGSQRLRTLQDFVLGDMRLKTLEVLDKISGFSFGDLSEPRQRKVKNRSIRGIVLHEHADEQARFDMFERINTGSKIANPTEVRRGVLAGPFMDLVIELANDEQFIGLAPMSKKQQLERGRDELVTRFFGYGDGLGDYRDRPAQFLFDYTKKMNGKFAEDSSLASAYRDRFRATMTFIEEYFPLGFRKTPSSRTTPRARFEALALGVHFALHDEPNLGTSIPVPSVDEWLSGPEFRAVTGSDGANAIARLKGRMDFVKERLLP